jgi:hypothetical protein
MIIRNFFATGKIAKQDIYDSPATITKVRVVNFDSPVHLPWMVFTA